MALNTSKCNHLPPLPFKGLMAMQVYKLFRLAPFPAYRVQRVKAKLSYLIWLARTTSCA